MQFSISASAVSAIILAGIANAQTTFSVATPSALQECTNYQITWTGGAAPFTIQITAPGNTASILETLATGVTGQSYTWPVNQPAGQKVTINIVDNNGANAPSAQSPAIATGSTSCLAAGSSSSSAASSSSSASTSPSSSASRASSSTAASPSTAASSSSRTSPTGSSSSAPAATSAPATDGASNVRGYTAVAAGIVGVFAAGLL